MLSFSKPDVEYFFQTFGIQTFAVSPDESQLVFSTNLNGKYNLWAMDLPNQFPYPLSFQNQSCQEIEYDKEGRFLLAVIDSDGDENGQVYALPRNGGELKPIRTHENARHMGLIASKDGKTLYYTSSKEDATFLKAYAYNMETGEEKVLLHGRDAATFLTAKSPDEKRFVFGRMFANTYSLAYAWDGEKEVLLTPEAEPQHTVTDAVFTSENDIYLVTNYKEDLSYLAKFNLETNEFTKILSLDGEDFSGLKYDKKGHTLYISSQKGAEDHLYRYGLEEGKAEQLELPASTIDGLSVAESGNLYLLGRSAVTPPNLYKYEKGEWTQLTNNRVPGVSEEEMAEPEILHYPSYDGLEIEALFFRAKEENSNGHVILWPHGGPQAAERASFRSLFQFLVHRGYSIFAPNFRGSSGYGLSYMKMVEGDWGYGPRLDNVEGLEWLIKNGYAEREKLLLMGGSYGGYMALLLHGRHPEYFKAVVDIFGPSDLFSFIESVPEHWKPVMNQWVGDPVKDKEKLIEYSPITYLDTMTKPMLVIQGAKDPRVVKAESDKIVAALQEKGREVEYMVLDDEGHGFSKKDNEIKVYRKVLEFFDGFIQ
ncbi:S9 family peptidase [Bacillus sp. AG4(2022)]|jgi:dipeptidyl aminopeptidase/acylaminoacyl peptidase|uniref:S9 family peptidase n=1 Tax=Bacillus sp. AG4(2022) TaxID=2962594 RepID=UPI0028828F76|nr:S9 family peptidase [Bacillus sp. AG4(2022)]MDT0161405.1 S9 family peptidase [Bacillus sp. AG4(2022)]